MSTKKDNIVLIRIGWAIYWDNPNQFVSNEGETTGPGLEATQWFSYKDILLV